MSAVFAQRFEAVVVDWDAVVRTGGWADTSGPRSSIEELCNLGCDLAVVTDAPVADIRDRLDARPSGPGRLLLCGDPGSQVFEAREDGLRLLYRRAATRAEEIALDAAAAATVAALRRLGLRADVASRDLSRRSIAPARGTTAWTADIARGAAADAGLADAHVTTDAGHVEIGLTGKSDSLRWVLSHLWTHGVGAVLVIGDDLGALRTPPGMLVSRARAGLLRRVLFDQARRRRRRDVPEVAAAAEWRITVEQFDPHLERVHESLLTIADGRLGTRGSPIGADDATTPGVFMAGCYDGAGPETELARLPSWSRLADGQAARPRRRTIDLHTGVLCEEGALTALRFSSLTHPGTVVMRARGNQTLLPSGGATTVGGRVTAALRDRRHGAVVERFGAYDPDTTTAEAAAATAEDAGFERLLREHR